MWLMLQQDKPDDFVVATGDVYSLGECLDVAFNQVGISDWTKYVGQDPRFMRPADVFYLAGDSSKARSELGWKPKTSFETMIRKMI